MIGYQLINGVKRSKPSVKNKQQCEECGKQRVLLATTLCTCGQQVCKGCHKKLIKENRRGGCPLCSLSQEFKIEGIQTGGEGGKFPEFEVSLQTSNKLLLTSINPPSSLSDNESEDQTIESDVKSQSTDETIASDKPTPRKLNEQIKKQSKKIPQINIFSKKIQESKTMAEKSKKQNDKISGNQNTVGNQSATVKKVTCSTENQNITNHNNSSQKQTKKQVPTEDNSDGIKVTAPKNFQNYFDNLKEGQIKKQKNSHENSSGISSQQSLKVDNKNTKNNNYASITKNSISNDENQKKSNQQKTLQSSVQKTSLQKMQDDRIDAKLNAVEISPTNPVRKKVQSGDEATTISKNAEVSKIQTMATKLKSQKCSEISIENQGVLDEQQAAQNGRIQKHQNQELQLKKHFCNYDQIEYEGDRVIDQPRQLNNPPICPPSQNNQVKQSVWTKNPNEKNFPNSKLRSLQNDTSEIFSLLVQLFKEQDEIDEFYAKIYEVLDEQIKLEKQLSESLEEFGFVSSQSQDLVVNLPSSLDDQESDKLSEIFEKNQSQSKNQKKESPSPPENQKNESPSPPKNFEQEMPKFYARKIDYPEFILQQQQQQYSPQFIQQEYQKQPQENNFFPHENYLKLQHSRNMSPQQLSPTSMLYYQQKQQHQQHMEQLLSYQQQQHYLQQQQQQQQQQLGFGGWVPTEPPPPVMYHFVPKYCTYDARGYVWYMEPAVHTHYVVQDSRFFPTFVQQV